MTVATATPLRAADTLVLQPAQITALGIETAVVQDGSASRQGGLPGKVTVPNAQMRVVAAPVAGMIESLLVAPGSAVKKGQAVARLASREALELQREMLQTGSQAALAQQNLKRDEQLFAEGLIAESRLQASRAAAAQAGAQAAERRQGLALAGVAPGKVGGPLALVAPIDGVVLEQGVQVGQRVDGSTLIFRIAKLSPLWLEIQAPLATAQGLQEGGPVSVPAAGAKGRLIAVGRAVEAASQSVLLRALVESGEESLRPGQVVEVEVDGAARGIRLPAAALARQDGQAVVFVQTAADKTPAFRPRTVKVLGQSGDHVQVDGVAAGERVAVRGVSGLKALWTGVGQE